MSDSLQTHVYQIAYEPNLVPPLHLMRQEGIDVLEEWFRWGEEWNMILKIYGKLAREGRVLEIGCGLGRIAFPLRYTLSNNGRYSGFEIIKEKIDFLKNNFEPAYPNFDFTWANISNTYYNPKGQILPERYQFPYKANQFDLVFAASVFTHLLPEVTAQYFKETARVLKPGGRVVFSFFLLDFYEPNKERPLGFARDIFDFAHPYEDYGDEFAIVVPENPEQMTAYHTSLLFKYANDAGLSVVDQPIPGVWSGTASSWVSAQDLIVFQKMDPINGHG